MQQSREKKKRKRYKAMDNWRTIIKTKTRIRCCFLTIGPFQLPLTNLVLSLTSQSDGRQKPFLTAIKQVICIS